MERKKSYNYTHQKVCTQGVNIMYNRHLETFIHAADSGSFLKASEKLYISPNAVTKQINLLESHLNLKLFKRSRQGLELTEAGTLIYTEAKKIIRHSNSVIRKAQDLEKRDDFVIRIGVSLMNPANILLELWQKASQDYPNIRLDLVPYEDSVPVFNKVLEQLGKKIDLIPCPYDTRSRGNYLTFYLKDLPLCIICSRNHRLAEKSILDIEDLYGETLLMGKRGNGNYLDAVRNELEQNHSQIFLKDMEYIELETFNQIVSSNEMIIASECWSNVHPLLVTIPVKWDFVLPYGLIYAPDPSKEVLQFIMAIGQTGGNQ